MVHVGVGFFLSDVLKCVQTVSSALQHLPLFLCGGCGHKVHLSLSCSRGFWCPTTFAVFLAKRESWCSSSSCSHFSLSITMLTEANLHRKHAANNQLPNCSLPAEDLICQMAPITGLNSKGSCHTNMFFKACSVCYH